MSVAHGALCCLLDIPALIQHQELTCRFLMSIHSYVHCLFASQHRLSSTITPLLLNVSAPRAPPPLHTHRSPAPPPGRDCAMHSCYTPCVYSLRFFLPHGPLVATYIARIAPTPKMPPKFVMFFICCKHWLLTGPLRSRPWGRSQLTFFQTIGRQHPPWCRSCHDAGDAPLGQHVKDGLNTLQTVQARK